MLHSLEGYFGTDVSGQPLCPIFRGQAARERLLVNFLILAYGTVRLSRKVWN